MKHLFNVARYILASYGLLVMASNLQKVAKKSQGEDSEESHITEQRHGSEHELKNVALYGTNDSETLRLYARLNDLMRYIGKITYSDVNQILADCGMPKVLEDSESVGWDPENFKTDVQYSTEIGCIAIFLPKAKKLA